jgi:hypothetical protein
MVSNTDAPPEFETAGPDLPRLRRSLLLNRRLWLGVVLGLGCLVLAMADIDFGATAGALRSANLFWVGLAGMTALLTGALKGWRWHLLLYPVPVAQTPSAPPAARRISAPRLTNIWMAGAGVNLALPVPRGGDVLRVYLAGEAGAASKSLVIGTIAAEKLLDMVILALCFLGLLLFVAMPQELAQRQTPTVGVTILLVLAVAAVLWQRERLLALTGGLLQRLPHGQQAAASMAQALQGLDALRQPSRLLAVSGLTAVIGLLSVATAYLIFLALDMPPSWVQSTFLWVVLQVGVTVPSTPGKIGVFQVLCRWTLGLFGVPAALGLAYGVLLYVAVPLLLMISGALALAIEGWRMGRLPATFDLGLRQPPVPQDTAVGRGK